MPSSRTSTNARSLVEGHGTVLDCACNQPVVETEHQSCERTFQYTAFQVCIVPLLKQFLHIMPC